MRLSVLFLTSIICLSSVLSVQAQVMTLPIRRENTFHQLYTRTAWSFDQSIGGTPVGNPGGDTGIISDDNDANAAVYYANFTGSFWDYIDTNTGAQWYSPSLGGTSDAPGTGTLGQTFVGSYVYSDPNNTNDYSVSVNVYNTTGQLALMTIQEDPGDPPADPPVDTDGESIQNGGLGTQSVELRAAMWLMFSQGPIDSHVTTTVDMFVGVRNSTVTASYLGAAGWSVEGDLSQECRDDENAPREQFAYIQGGDTLSIGYDCVSLHQVGESFLVGQSVEEEISAHLTVSEGATDNFYYNSYFATDIGMEADDTY